MASPWYTKFYLHTQQRTQKYFMNFFFAIKLLERSKEIIQGLHAILCAYNFDRKVKCVIDETKIIYMLWLVSMDNIIQSTVENGNAVAFDLWIIVIFMMFGFMFLGDDMFDIAQRISLH